MERTELTDLYVSSEVLYLEIPYCFTYMDRFQQYQNNNH